MATMLVIADVISQHSRVSGFFGCLPHAAVQPRYSLVSLAKIAGWLETHLEDWQLSVTNRGLAARPHSEDEVT